MPYITENRRRDLATYDKPRTAGELNYVFTQAIVGYVKKRGLSYATINDIVGALHCASDEFSRRIVAAYEDHKLVDNGDVYQEILPG